jgi:uncharacterized protein YbjT (DUF2867 family)
MNVVLFGATGMIGQGVLRECVRDDNVARVLAIGRRASGVQHPKLREIVKDDAADLDKVDDDLSAYDACFYCLGVSSAGLSEDAYRHVTYEMTMMAARTLAARAPAMTFVYVSGTGADSTEQGRVMWARVKGRTENALMRLPFQAVYIFRPGFIQPLHGIKSRTPLYNAIYTVLGPLYPILNAIAPRYVTTTEQVGRAMIAVAAHGAPQRILENRDINEAARRA